MGHQELADLPPPVSHPWTSGDSPSTTGKDQPGEGVTNDNQAAMLALAAVPAPELSDITKDLAECLESTQDFDEAVTEDLAPGRELAGEPAVTSRAPKEEGSGAAEEDGAGLEGAIGAGAGSGDGDERDKAAARAQAIEALKRSWARQRCGEG
jgi:hypothetical protein